MVAQITSLINKSDSFEIVRDRIAQILADESAGQMALATAEGLDPELWRLNVRIERSIPWDTLEDGQHVVNVWFDTGNPDGKPSTVVADQAYNGTFNIDVVAAGSAQLTPDGHMSGDEVAARNAQRITRLCRNILMASHHTYLGLRQKERPEVCVGKRWVQAINTFQPQLDNRAADHILGMRIELAVRYSEFAPQYEGETLQYVSNTIQDPDGFVLAQTDYDY